MHNNYVYFINLKILEAQNFLRLAMLKLLMNNHKTSRVTINLP